ncbi:WASH complex subunit 2C-like isoform X2 [Ischnura elegans]|uniref:WASH complex subunit 2C-like isoform X2 n=1 Tax=Ischnura elegans TaxID=197161 RepID=UPI001ED88E50|nr:WASH complex subunit 2C-like isoform X2 [Ischnura elegans]
MDDSSVEKAWERPWSTEEMRRQCSSWNLAGDAGLLKHLQEFSQNLMQKTHTAEVALDSLLEDMRNTTVDVQNATNALLMLSNNQFVENRVYDDCEDEKEEVGTGDDGSVKVASSSSTTVGNSDSLLIAKAAEAILLGMSVIDTKFDCVEVPASDSEGEEEVGQNASNAKSFALVLEPRNPYASWPLPHLIGSKEFMEDDRVGLGVGLDEDDEEEEDDAHLSLDQDQAMQALDDSSSSLVGGDEGIFDEVDDGMPSKGQGMKQAWESSSSSASDDLVVEKNIMRKKPKVMVASHGGASSPFRNEDEDDEGDLFGVKDSSSGDEEFMESIQRQQRPTLPKTKEEDFDDEKVVKVIPEKRKVESEDKKVSEVKRVDISAIIDPSDNLFGPPQDEWKDDDDEGDDSIFAGSDGIFSGGRGLFDDLEDPFRPGNQHDDKPPAFKGADGNGVVLSKGSRDIFGEDGEEQDVFASSSRAKAPGPQQLREEREETVRKEKDSKGVEDGWSFDDPEQDDPLWSIAAKEETSRRGDRAEAEKSSKGNFNENGKADTAQPKLPVGARSFYAGGIDPLALGKKLTKELEGKRKMKEQEGEDASGKMVVPAHSNSDHKGVAVKEKSEKGPKYKGSDSGSLFDDMGNADDLFAFASSKPKDTSIGEQCDVTDKNLFAPIESASISAKVEEIQRKLPKTISSGVAGKERTNLFDDFDSDGEDIFAGSKARPPSSTSKSISNKGQKTLSVSPDPLFGDVLGKDEELFPGSHEKSMFSEKKLEDDLFSDFNDVEGGESIINGKEEPSKEIKSEVPWFNDYEGSFTDDLKKSNKKGSDSDRLFGVQKVEGDDSKSSGKVEEFSSTYSAKSARIEFDDIFGDTDDKLMVVGAIKSVDASPRICDDVAKSMDANKQSSEANKTSKLTNLFDDFTSDDEDDFLNSTRRHNLRKPSQPSDSLFSSEPTNSSDLFSEISCDGDDGKLFASKGVKAKAKEPLDPLGDDLFLSTKPPKMADALASDVEVVKQEEEGGIIEGEHVSRGARKSPPKTLDLVIGWPKAAVAVEEAEDDQVVEAWMKGQPPTLHADGSNVPTASPTPSDALLNKHQVNSSYFADIPSASLLHSHGKERVKIQGHRRPPSRKVRKGTGVEQAAQPPPPGLAAAAAAVVEVGGGGEEVEGEGMTTEEWSTPEAGGLTSPAPPLPPSNPLSPSTDEEQDFFDVLPVVGPPPIEPPTPSSPFSDAVGGDAAWDDGALFEDAQAMGPGSPMCDPTSSSAAVVKGHLDAEDLFCKGGGGSGEVAKKSKLDGDLWANGVPSSTKGNKGDDIFSEDFEPSRAADLDDIFGGEGDLFGSVSSQQTKEQTFRGNSVLGRGGMGKSLSKLDSKSRGGPVSLFGDDDGDEAEDLFSSSLPSNQTAPRKASKLTEKSNQAKTSQLQPTKSSLVKVASACDDSIFEDPLMVLKRKE